MLEAKGACRPAESLRAVCTSPYVSPGSLTNTDSKSFDRFPPTYIQSGDAERILDEIRFLRDKMVESVGESKIVYDEVVSCQTQVAKR